MSLCISMLQLKGLLCEGVLETHRQLKCLRVIDNCHLSYMMHLRESQIVVYHHFIDFGPSYFFIQVIVEW